MRIARVGVAFDGNIRSLAMGNQFLRRLIYRGGHSQLAVMSLAPGDEVSEGPHDAFDQVLIIVEGRGTVVLDGRVHGADKHDCIVVPAGSPHRIVNGADADLKVFTIWSAREHV
jgi:mannose-6-phosphate isomerase-like protein (cupin superfamily)